MARNLNTDMTRSSKRVECQDRKHEGNRSVTNADWWMEWPDFDIRYDACRKKREKLNNIARKNGDAMSQQEQFELLHRDAE